MHEASNMANRTFALSGALTCHTLYTSQAGCIYQLVPCPGRTEHYMIVSAQQMQLSDFVKIRAKLSCISFWCQAKGLCAKRHSHCLEYKP